MIQYDTNERQFEVITTLDGLEDLLDKIGDGVAALDFETTSFTPQTGEVRLAQVCNKDVYAVIDFFAIGGFASVAEWFEDAAWIVFHAGFELRWFQYAGANPTCWDVGHLRRAIEGGGHFTLKKLVGWELGIEMSKEQQASNWSAPELSDEQLLYAARDALYTWDAWEKLKKRSDAGHMRAFNLLDGMLTAVIEMEETGLVLDRSVHQDLVDKWELLAVDREAEVRKMITEDEVANLNSGKQLSDFFSKIMPDHILEAWPRTEKTGALSTANDDLKQVGALVHGTPLQDTLILLSERSTLQKYISSFGTGLITRATMDPNRRVHARYNIAAAITCRFSSSAPNLQQIPRDRDFFGERLSVRRSFIAPEGKQLVSLDYSGIELRVLALLSGDEQLLDDMINGDVHLEVGSHMAGRKLDKKITADKEIRQSAKGVSFGIVYGITALGLSAAMKRSYEEAQSYIDFWASRYSKAFAFRDAVQTEAFDTGGYIRVIDGGTIWMGKRPSITKCANYPVQRAALSIMASAIIRHHETVVDLRSHGRDIRMASTIHDALIDEVAQADAQAALLAMKADMVGGYKDIFPHAPTDRLVEGGIGPNWGQLEDVEV